jgi:hypothetical protein
MAARILSLPTPEQLRELLRYEPDTGKLFWKERPLSMFPSPRHQGSWNTRYAGREALIELHPSGYLRGRVFNRVYYAHRVVWATVHGLWPDAHIDHINGDKADNRLVNLRAATQQQNNRNTGKRKDNASGFKGVCFHLRSKKWMASISIGGSKSTYLGLFDTPEEAHAAYCSAAQKHHGEFAKTQ